MDAFFRTYGYTIVMMVIYALLALSLYLPLMAGQLSLASPGFYLMGGYVSGLLSVGGFKGLVGDSNSYPAWALLIQMVLAGLLCGLVGFVIGVIVLRLKGIFLALATIAFVEILNKSATAFKEFTYGPEGVPNIPQPFPTQFAYILAAAPLLIFAMFFMYRLERTRAGRAFTAIREDELAASAMGIDTTRYKILSFVLGSIVAGMAGAISAHINNTWNPSFGTFDASILILASVLVGGSRTFVGAVVGGMLISVLPELLRALAGTPGISDALRKAIADSRLIIFGVLITLCAITFPQGLINPDFFTRFRRPSTPTPVQTRPTGVQT